jgi:hypothetical protein
VITQVHLALFNTGGGGGGGADGGVGGAGGSGLVIVRYTLAKAFGGNSLLILVLTGYTHLQVQEHFTPTEVFDCSLP